MNTISLVAASFAPRRVGILAHVFSVGLLLNFLAVARSDDLPVTAGLLLHLDSAVDVTRDASNGVTLWLDQSSQRNSALPTGARPLWVGGALNGRPVIRFDGGPDFLVLDDPVPIQPSTIWAVFQSSSSPVGGAVLSGDNFSVQRGGSNELQINDFYHSGLLFHHPTFRIISATIPDANHLTISSEGLQFVGGSPNFTAPVSTLRYLGQRDDGQPFVGDLAELIVFDHPLSLTDERLVGSYLADKYALPYGYALPQGAQLVAFTLFEEPPIGTSNYSRQSPSGEMGFTTVSIPNAGAADPLAQVIATSSSQTPILSHRSVTATTTFENVDLSRWENVSVEILVQVRNTGYELGDFVHAFVTNGNASIDLVNLAGLDGVAVDSLERAASQGYLLSSASIPRGWRSARLVIESSSNSSTGAERYDFDKIQFHGVPVPEPSSLLLAAVGMLAVGWLRVRAGAFRLLGHWGSTVMCRNIKITFKE